MNGEDRDRRRFNARSALGLFIVAIFATAAMFVLPPLPEIRKPEATTAERQDFLRGVERSASYCGTLREISEQISCLSRQADLILDIVWKEDERTAEQAALAYLKGRPLDALSRRSAGEPGR